MSTLCKVMRPIWMSTYTLIAGCLIAMSAAPARGAALTLDEAVRRALAFAPAITAATAQSDLSAAMVRQARAPLYPSLSAGSEYYQAPGYSKAVSNGGLSDALLTLDWTAYDFGRREASARAALYQSEAARYGLSTARAQIVFDTTVAYYNLLRAHQAERELDSNAERMKRYVSVVKHLRASGAAITSDVLKVETASNSAELALADAHGAAVRASAALGILIGKFGRSDIEVAKVRGLPPWPGEDLSRNPMLESARRRVAAARANVQAAMRERYPNIKLTLTAGWQGINPPRTFTHDAGASYDGAISMPIFDGGLIASHIDGAQAKVLAAQAEVRQVELDLRRRLADAAPRYRLARRQLALIARAQPIADDDFNLMWARFLGGGNVTLISVLDAYRQAEQLRLARPQDEFAVRQAAAEGNLALGVDR